MRYSLKWPEYAKQWDSMTIKADRLKGFEAEAKFAIEHRERYYAIERRSGVPWAVIAVLHRRESDADFTTYLGNGDKLTRPTTHVPKKRGPFQSFEDGAVDALKLDHLTDVSDWRLEKALYEAELFNGAGYANKGVPSPYIWGGTSVQVRGKFIRDYVYSRTAWDPQPGCAPLLAMIMKLDPTVMLPRET